jgi:hypothetical protein
MQRTTCNTRHATCNTQHAKHNLQLRAGSLSVSGMADRYLSHRRTSRAAKSESARAVERRRGSQRLAPWADSQPGPTRREYRIVYYAACLSPCCMRHCALHVALRQPPACRRHAPRSPASHRHILAADRRVPTTRDSAPLIHSVIQQSTTCGSAVHMHCNANRNTAERELSRSVTVDERKA